MLGSGSRAHSQPGRRSIARDRILLLASWRAVSFRHNFVPSPFYRSRLIQIAVLRSEPLVGGTSLRTLGGPSLGVVVRTSCNLMSLHGSRHLDMVPINSFHGLRVLDPDRHRCTAAMRYESNHLGGPQLPINMMDLRLTMPSVRMLRFTTTTRCCSIL